MKKLKITRKIDSAGQPTQSEDLLRKSSLQKEREFTSRFFASINHRIVAIATEGRRGSSLHAFLLPKAIIGAADWASKSFRLQIVENFGPALLTHEIHPVLFTAAETLDNSRS